MKLNREEVIRLHQGGTPVPEIAALYGATPEAVKYHLRPEHEREAIRARANERQKQQVRGLREAVVAATGEFNRINQEIRTLAATTAMTYEEIAQHLGVSKKRVKYWVNERERERRSEEARRRAARIQAQRKTAIAVRVEKKEAEIVESAYSRMINTKFHHTRSQALRRGLEFSLTKDAFRKAVDAEACERTGLPLRAKGDGDDCVWTLDRINNSLGYTKDNVQVVSWIYNRAKGASTDAAVLRMAVALVGKTLEDQQISFEQLKLQTLGYNWD